jgi:pilus assembly protein TadC
MIMNLDTGKAWTVLGIAAGAGFGLFAMPLLFLLVNMFFDGSSFGGTFKFALANGFTWGVLGGILGLFFWIIRSFRRRGTTR